MHDWELLKAYVEDGSQAAFAALVERHINFVYAACLREVRDAALAEDVAQVVFLILSKKAATLRAGTVLSGWLFQTARFAAKNALQQETRRRQREQRAAEEMTSDLETHGDTRWEEIEPLLHDALSRLGTEERNAILVRFFENRSLRDTGAVLGVSEEAARKRVTRAVEKLRRHFSRHGLLLSGAVLITLISQNAAPAAPAQCPESILRATSSTAGGAATAGLISGGVLSLYDVVLKAMLASQVRLAAKVLAALTLAAFVTFQAVQFAAPDKPVSRILKRMQQPADRDQHGTPRSGRIASLAAPMLVTPMAPVGANAHELSTAFMASSVSGIPRRVMDKHAGLEQEPLRYKSSELERQPVSQWRTNWKSDTPTKTRRITLKMNDKIKLTKPHSRAATAKFVGALLGIRAAQGIAGKVLAQAQPPATLTPAVAKVDQNPESQEPETHNLVMVARLVEMSTADLDAFGIDFKTPPPTVLEASTSYGGQGLVDDPKKTVKNEPPTMFSFGTAQEEFTAKLNALIAAKKARFISPTGDEIQMRMTDRATYVKFPVKLPTIPYSATYSSPITLGPTGLVDTRNINKTKTGSPNLYVTTSVGVDITPALNADGTLTLTLRSPVQIYLQTGLKETSDTVTVFSRSTQPVEVITDHVRKDPIPNIVTITPPNTTGLAKDVRVVPPPRLTITPSLLMQGGGNYIVTPTPSRTIKDATTTSTLSPETVVTLQNKGTVVMRGIRTRTIRQADQDITMWSYVPTLGRLLNNDEGAEPEKELVCFVTVTYSTGWPPRETP